MSITAPKIDPRTAADIRLDVQRLLREYTKAWPDYDPASDELSAGLVGIFARLTEIVIERLNQVPDKNLLAFLDLLGASRLPPQPARVPLTFSLAPGTVNDVQVPSGTPVAAALAEGESAPLAFETQSKMWVTAARLDAAFTLDPEQDTFADRGSLVSGAGGGDQALFLGDRRHEHVLYLAHEQLLGEPSIRSLRVNVAVAATATGRDPLVLAWEIWNGTEWSARAALTDTTGNLATDGVVDLGSIPSVEPRAVGSKLSRWLRCRLLTPVTQASEQRARMVRAGGLPKLRQVQLEAWLQRSAVQGLRPDAGFINSSPVDLTKPFFAFGEKPKLGDALYLASSEALSQDRGDGVALINPFVELDVRLANSHLSADASSVWPSDDLQVAWECWTAGGWQLLGTGAPPTWRALIELDPVPEYTDDASTVVSGRVGPRAQVTVATKLVKVGPDGRFVASAGVSDAATEIPVSVSSGIKKASSWVVVTRGSPEAQKARLVVTTPPPPLPPGTTSVTVKVQVEGPGAASVANIEIQSANASGGKLGSVSGPAPATLKVPVDIGRTRLLIRGLPASAGAPPLAAVTMDVSVPPKPDAGVADGTCGLCVSGTVRFPLPAGVAKTVINGQDGYWLRARLLRGDYGKEASYIQKIITTSTDPGFSLLPATFRPPQVEAVQIGYDVTARATLRACLTVNNGDVQDVTAAAAGKSDAFPAFAPSPVTRPTIFLGFSLPAGRSAFPNRPLSIFASVVGARYGEREVPISPSQSALASEAGQPALHEFRITSAADSVRQYGLELIGTRWLTNLDSASLTLGPGEERKVLVSVTVPPDSVQGDWDRGFLRMYAQAQPDQLFTATFVTYAGTQGAAEPAKVAWQYWNGRQWSKLTLRDEAQGFTIPGVMEVLAPADIAPDRRFGLDRYWVRAELASGEYPAPARADRLLLNTVSAAQAVTVLNEVLGSSNAQAGQRFRCARQPVLDRQQVEIREPELPSAEELEQLRREEGPDALRIVPDATGRPREIWVRWHEVPDFYASLAQDRHYVLDHLTGELRFGDGINGRIPASGSGNIRLARYRTSAGERGNRAAGTITQLKTTIPYVDKVANLTAASGGADPETLEALRLRAPKMVRHRSRAVTPEDFEDLALLATPEVARARCVPLRQLAADPLGNDFRPGAVSVIIVPRTGAAKPMPPVELTGRVARFLRTCASAGTEIAVVGPQYLRVQVTAEVAVSTLDVAAEVEQRVYQRLDEFLHPLTGGLDRGGWDFGRAPHRSDFYALIEAIPGVDHIRRLELSDLEEMDGVRGTQRFLVYSGEHRISLVFGEI